VTTRLRIGLDVGGTKIAAVALGEGDEPLASKRAATPRGDYAGTLAEIARLVDEIEGQIGPSSTIGIGIPGSISPSTGKVQNANSTWLNGRPLEADLRDKLKRPFRIANDANCFALSEALNGSGNGAACVFGVILGTGCGGGLVVNRSLVNGPLGIGGEWGHNPLPWPEPEEMPGPQCWCGRAGCIETWVSGPGLSADHARWGNEAADAETIAAQAAQDDGSAGATLERHAGRLARALASIVNIIDPDVVVLGGGLSQLPHLYQDVPRLMAPFIFSQSPAIDIQPPTHGPESGVRGAAELWD